MSKFDIMILEDNESDAMLMREAVQNTLMGNNLFIVSSVTEALKFLNQQEEHEDKPRPDLIIMDLRMPDLDGHEFLKIVKKDARFSMIPVIVLTSSDDEGDITKSYKLLANCYIVKPVNFVRFKKVVSVINDFWLGVARLPPK